MSLCEPRSPSLSQVARPKVTTDIRVHAVYVVKFNRHRRLLIPGSRLAERPYDDCHSGVQEVHLPVLTLCEPEMIECQCRKRGRARLRGNRERMYCISALKASFNYLRSAHHAHSATYPSQWKPLLTSHPQQAGDIQNGKHGIADLRRQFQDSPEIK
jgi:hypothetical protein